MKSIEVDFDVFAAIWKRRNPGEDNENSILRRLLLAHGKQSTLGRPSASEENPSRPQPGTDIFKETEMGKIRWVDDIRATLVALGGRANLENLYRAVEKRRIVGGRSVPRTLDAVVRRTLEDHSSDSANFRGADLFKLIGRGEWAIR